MMEYRGRRGVVIFDDEAGLLHGEVVDTRDVITFQGSSVSEVRQAFRDSVDEYLTICSERGREPDRPYSGRIALRLPSQVHRAAAAAARTERKSLNAWLTELIGREVKTYP